jgi:peptidoglycan/xylan/chitin deacetylase (PgdA/CDA1 family)
MTANVQAAVPLVTIVTYHFVRPVSMRFPRFARLEPAAFREQLRYIRRHYTPIRLSDVVASIEGSTVLPPRPAVLTFDDGYRDHYETVYPLLVEHGMSATFFPARSSLLDRRVLGSNKVQFILAAAGDTRTIIDAIDRAIETSSTPETGTVADCRTRWWAPSRFDTADVVYVKRMLQHGLPEHVRTSLLDALFHRYVTGDEAAFADELYMAVDEARQMRASGMEFGGHGDQHVPLPALEPDAQAREIDGAIETLDAIGTPHTRFAYSYVKGEYDAASVALLRARGCAIAVTTRQDLARPRIDDELTLPRIDTTLLPVEGDATPNEWTLRAMT